MLELILGFTNPVSITAPPGIAFRLEKNSITIEGADREAVGQVAADIRGLRPPEPYKGKGIRYLNEFVKKKVGKTGA